MSSSGKALVTIKHRPVSSEKVDINNSSDGGDGDDHKNIYYKDEYARVVVGDKGALIKLQEVENHQAKRPRLDMNKTQVSFEKKSYR